MSNRPTFLNARVAFIVLTWNSAQWIENCIGSILSLKCKELRLFVEDNGSTDRTLEILDRFERADSRLTVERLGRNLGTTVPRNRAIRRIMQDADYVCILDSDTVVNQQAFDTMANVLHTDQTIGVVGPTMFNSMGEEQLSGRNLPTVAIKLGKACPIRAISDMAHQAEVPEPPEPDGLQDVGYLLSACWLVPSDVFMTVGLLDEKIFYAPEDVDWCARCHQAGYRVVRTATANIVHEYQRLSHRTLISKINFEHIKGLIYYFCKVHRRL